MSKLENKASASYVISTSEGNKYFSIDSNTVEFQKLDDELKLHKSVYPKYGASGDKVTFSILAEATAPISATVTDKLSGFTFVPGSVKIDNVPNTDANFIWGINLPELMSAPATCNITFDCTVD